MVYLMGRKWRQITASLDRADIGGWAMLFAGVGLLGVALLLPAWHEWQVVAGQQAVLSGRLEQIGARHGNYVKLIRAVEHGDPLLLQRLAWHEFNLKPAGARPMAFTALPVDGRPVGYRQWVAPPVPDLTAAPLGDPTVLAWIEVRQPVLLGAGGVLIGLGLLSSLRGAPKEQAVSRRDGR